MLGNRKNNRITAKDILKIYRDNSLLTKLHVWFRFKTCPFLWLEEHVPKKGLIIDYGCGHGIFSHILSILSPEREIFGVDISNKKIKEAQRTKIENRKIKFLNDVNLDSLLKQADCVTIIDVLCYFPTKYREKFLKNIFNKLKNEAVVIIKDMNKSFSLKFFLLYLQDFFTVKIFKITQAQRLNFFEVKDFLKILKDIDFEVRFIDINRYYPYPHVVFVCRKV